MRGPWRAAVAALGLAVAAPAAAEIPVVELDGVVHAVTAAHVVQAIEEADAAGAPLLILRLDTPGGLDTSMRQIIDAMLNCRTPVAVFVGPSGSRAASAGFIITVSADVAAMAPGTNIGAAHPVSGMGKMDEVMSEKVTSDAAAYIRGKAERRGPQRGDGGEGGGGEQVLHRDRGPRAGAHRPRSRRTCPTSSPSSRAGR